MLAKVRYMALASLSLGLPLISAQQQRNEVDHGVTGEYLKFGVMSDIHIRRDYNPATGDNYCLIPDWQPPDSLLRRAYNSLTSLLKTAETDQSAPLGRLKCDIPPELLDYTLATFVQNNGEGTDGPADYILLNGDLVGHYVSQRSHKPANPALYKELKATHQVV